VVNLFTAHHTRAPQPQPKNAANQPSAAASGLPFPPLLPQTQSTMNKKPLLLLAITFAILGSLATSAHPPAAPSPNAPTYTSDGQLRLPANYRQWVYLTTGFDMSYNPAMSMDHHMFDNVFVNPESYQSFLKTGTWPDKTMLVLEVRGAQSKGSINQSGHFQDTDLMGLEVHVKDESRFHAQGNWAFFGFNGEALATAKAATASDSYGNSSASKQGAQNASGSGAQNASGSGARSASATGATQANNLPTSQMTPTTEACYSCHAQHAAVDTTFVQFYPTLLPISQTHQTLSPSYVKESSK
jgi:hypothetical protein